MSTQYILEKNVVKNPRSKEWVQVLAVWYQDEQHNSRFTALRRAAKIARDMRTANELAEAARLLRNPSPARWELLLAIHEHLDPVNFGDLDVRIVAGSRPPRVNSSWGITDKGIIWDRSVSVGARWVIKSVLDMRVEPTEQEIEDALNFGRTI